MTIRGGSLLPSGYLSTQGSQIVDADGNPVRIASIAWYGTDGPAGSALQGLWTESYEHILDSVKADGLNTVRIPWSNADLHTPFAGTNQLGGVDWSKNADLKGLTTLQVFQKIVDYAGQIGLKIVFDHHTDDGSGGQQPNGSWIDKGPGTNGTDGAGVQGTVDAAQFQADWVEFAKTFAGNSTVIGFDLDNEPTAQGVTWGGGGANDIHKMYTDVGNAIQAVDPGKLIIAEGVVTYDGTAYPMDFSGVKTNPVVLNTSDKVVYSPHDYPYEIGADPRDSGQVAIDAMNKQWGWIVKNNVAPVWIGEMGSNMVSSDAQAWASTLLDYMNGKDGAQGGPTFAGNQQPIGGDWWNLGWENGAPGTGAGGGNPDGNQDAWGVGHYRPLQQAVTDQMLFKAAAAVSPPLAANTLTLSLSEDAWQGDAQCVVSIDGKTVGGTVTVTASHAQGESQTVTLTGQWGPGAHDVGVQFINDAWGGTTATDRNLYVNGVSLDGQAAPGTPITQYSNGTAHVATGASPLVLQLSEDAWQGDAQFTVSVDGKQLGDAQAVTASYGAGAVQNFAFAQAMAAGTHDVAVSFLNDAWGGTAATDRNLYVNAIDANGAVLPGTAAALMTTSTQHFSVTVPVQS